MKDHPGLMPYYRPYKNTGTAILLAVILLASMGVI